MTWHCAASFSLWTSTSTLSSTMFQSSTPRHIRSWCVVLTRGDGECAVPLHAAMRSCRPHCHTHICSVHFRAIPVPSLLLSPLPHPPSVSWVALVEELLHSRIGGAICAGPSRRGGHRIPAGRSTARGCGGKEVRKPRRGYV